MPESTSMLHAAETSGSFRGVFPLVPDLHMCARWRRWCVLHRAMASGVANLKNQDRPEKNLDFSALQTIKKGNKHSE